MVAPAAECILVALLAAACVPRALALLAEELSRVAAELLPHQGQARHMLAACLLVAAEHRPLQSRDRLMEAEYVLAVECVRLVEVRVMA